MLIPDTYDKTFDDFYNRNITKYVYKDIFKVSYPYFVKSAGNDKSIDGTIIKNSDDVADLWCINQIFLYDDMELYVCDVVNFKVEYRLLVGDNKIYAIGYQKGNKSNFPSEHFLHKILEKSNGKYYCIDIGLISNSWSIVEINPPFSLDDFDISLNVYIEYAVDFWKYVRSKCPSIMNFFTTLLILET